MAANGANRASLSTFAGSDASEPARGWFSPAWIALSAWTRISGWTAGYSSRSELLMQTLYHTGMGGWLAALLMAQEQGRSGGDSTNWQLRGG
ncbi:MAG: hypothetical protein ABI577_17120 [bacterium]